MTEPHFCSDDCRRKDKPCDYCLAQRQFNHDKEARANAKPTLTHQPFASLLKS